MRPRLLLGAAAAATLAAALWWRKNPSACPYGQRFWVEAPHPIITRDRLREVLRPEPGERLLEIGVGTGYYSLDLAEWVGPDGTLELFDLQQEFLDHVMRAAPERGLDNLVPTQGDATALPYEDASVDAVVLTAVLGEIPDAAAALREIRRVLKPPAASSSASSSAIPTSPPAPASSGWAPRRAWASTALRQLVRLLRPPGACLRSACLARPRRVAVVEHQHVAVGVAEEGHVADAAVERLSLELDAL